MNSMETEQVAAPFSQFILNVVLRKVQGVGPV